MPIATFCPKLAKLLFAALPSARLETAAGEIAAFFSVQPHEVAYFQVDATRRSAVFRWPPQSGLTMDIPIKSHGSSLLCATAREERGFINNSFATTPHLHMFEHVLAEREQRIPVQKIISVPVVRDGTLRGILQVCRKGKSAVDAGLDFTGADLQHLEQIATVLARYDL
jgi:GAF domain-containing protein